MMYSVLRRLLPEITTTSHNRSRGEPVEKVVALRDAHAPARRILRARVERFHPPQIIVELGPGGRVHAHGRIDVRVHLLLDERGVEMTGIEHAEPH